MIPTIACIKSMSSRRTDMKLFGQYPLERNIRLLCHAGIRTIFLDLDKRDLAVFGRIRHRMEKLKGIRVVQSDGKKVKMNRPHVLLASSQFIQFHNLVRFDEFFKKKGNAFVIDHSELFMLDRTDDFARAESIVVRNVRMSAGGWFARNINKRISIPISRKLAVLGIHPNVLTFMNMIIMLAGSLCLLKNDYWYLLAAGTIFQFVSIFDGCDGEVAKFTSKFSSFGAKFDTFNDYLCLVVYLAGCSYIYYQTVGSVMAIVTICVAFTGLAIVIASVILYLVRFSQSRSFAAYAREFVYKLPPRDPVVWLTIKLQYFIRKEFYSLVGFLFAVAGALYLMIVYTAVTVLVASVLCVLLGLKYFPGLSRGKNGNEMVYISKRREG